MEEYLSQASQVDLHGEANREAKFHIRERYRRGSLPETIPSLYLRRPKEDSPSPWTKVKLVSVVDRGGSCIC